MKTKIHGIAGRVALLTISAFWVSTVIVELFGTHETIALVKRGIIWGMGILIPSIIATGVSGNLLGKNRAGALISAKKKRMPVIALNGLLILVPSAFFLNLCASNGEFSRAFYIAQGLELIAGAVNLFLIGSSVRDGVRLTGKNGQKSQTK
ncbi:MAG: hypothetical protein HGB11_08730 [Chlorobiales bacterium]|nr:hypothetical protein [Chlorobiales bacterium]